ncbi:helix-turn-helix domain-containing protein [Mycobacterium sp. PS03-16]|uniref:helix-turn-helix domain-containing protein n=1 Tax=Mycobacterium sp. PS03-16 TaxID=2559611 RepID=UPI001FD813EB|nr:helix-turn-helix transcriptional regulator [Mycobacterium sp. PS03-16]
MTSAPMTAAGPMSAAPTPPPFGAVLRDWRRRRRLSQLELAIEADVSARHVSFIETGRSAPSRAMVLRLAAALSVPPREQNRLLIAAGLAPVHPERTLDHPDLVAVRDGVQRLLAAYEPYPCVAVDRNWDIITANAATAVLLDGVSDALLTAPNAVRLALHPDGLAPRIDNLGQWRHHLLSRLRREVAASGAAELAALLADAESYPGTEAEPSGAAEVAVPLRLRTRDGARLTFLSTVTTFGTALDPAVSELSIEAFLPADDATAAALVCRAGVPGRPQADSASAPHRPGGVVDETEVAS